MTLVPIPKSVFNSLLSQTISRYIRRGIPRSEAVQKAHFIVGNAFTIQEPSDDSLPNPPQG